MGKEIPYLLVIMGKVGGKERGRMEVANKIVGPSK